MKLLFILSNLLITSITHAAGNGHDSGHASDLIAPAVNVAILVGFLVWKLKGPLKNYFTEKSTSVESQMHSAKNKAAEAQALIEKAEGKMKNLDAEINNIKLATKKEIAAFETEYEGETKNKMEKLLKDSDAKVEAEKAAGLNGLSEELVNNVIIQAKELVKNDPAKAKKVTEKLLQGLGK